MLSTMQEGYYIQVEVAFHSHQLEEFLNEVGWDAVLQILVNPTGSYTVIYKQIDNHIGK